MSSPLPRDSWLFPIMNRRLQGVVDAIISMGMDFCRLNSLYKNTEQKGNLFVISIGTSKLSFIKNLLFCTTLMMAT